MTDPGCAGIVRGADFLEMSEADFDDVISVNLKGVFLVRACSLCRASHDIEGMQICKQHAAGVTLLAEAHNGSSGVADRHADKCSIVFLRDGVRVASFCDWYTQCGQAAARQMVAQNAAQPGRGGAIVNMSSVNAVMAIPTIASYNASKGGVNNLTRHSTPRTTRAVQGSAAWCTARLFQH